jgi:hypothetical protein
VAGRKNADGLTPKQLAFCRAYVETGNASEAYRRSYNASAMKTATIGRKAMELMSNGTVTAYIAALKAEHDGAAAKALGLTREWVIDGLMKSARMGLGEEPMPETCNLPSANQALIALGKVDTIGMFVERAKVDLSKTFEEKTDEELEAFIASNAPLRG